MYSFAPIRVLNLTIMGVLKLSILDEMLKKQESEKPAKKYTHISACSCPCDCFIKEGEIRMDIAQTASWNID